MPERWRRQCQGFRRPPKRLRTGRETFVPLVAKRQRCCLPCSSFFDDGPKEATKTEITSFAASAFTTSTLPGMGVG